MRLRALAFLSLFIASAAFAAAMHTDATAAGCEHTLGAALARCFNRVSGRTRDCYLASGEACPSADGGVRAALRHLERSVLTRCDIGALTALGYGPLRTPAALVAQLQESCVGEVRSLAARTFGGPQAALLADDPSADTRSCLHSSNGEAAKLIHRSLQLQSRCIEQTHTGRSCDVDHLTAALQFRETIARAGIAAACRALPGLIGLDAAAFTNRALAQARCMVATSHADRGPLQLDCGQRAAVPSPPRGDWVHVILDNDTYGTRCGDGSPYAFWIRLAPTGSPVSRVLVNLEGGGVCVFESDCRAVKNSGGFLFQSLSHGQASGGYFSTNPTDNPFAAWSMVSLPYCTQDVYIGGGVTSTFSDFSVHRYGAPNLRAALRYVRDVLWAELESTTAEGYRPDELQVVFGGESAGAFGVEYNYHYVLDDLRWIHTTAVPDSGLALDNGTFPGVRALGGLLQAAPPAGWSARAFQPPYCLGGDCAVGPVLQARTSVRLKAVPDQQMLNVSNQIDGTQRATTYFSSMKNWTNAARQAYCATQGLNGIHFFLPANDTDIHTMLTTPSRFTGLTSDGVSLRDWLAAAIAEPDGVADRVEEGDLVSTLGVEPFACPVDVP